MVERVYHEGNLLAIIVPGSFTEPGIHFFTPDDHSQQLAYMQHPAGKTIPPHVHNPVARQVHYTQEVLFIRRGKLRLDLYDEQRNYLESHFLSAGDTVLLATGGHGFEVIEEIEMLEVKQGPYAGDRDKTRFEPVANDRLRVV